MHTPLASPSFSSPPAVNYIFTRVNDEKTGPWIILAHDTYMFYYTGGVVLHFLGQVLHDHHTEYLDINVLQCCIGQQQGIKTLKPYKSSM